MSQPIRLHFLGQEWELSGLSAVPESQLKSAPSPAPAPFWLREALADSSARRRLWRKMQEAGLGAGVESGELPRDLAWLSQALAEGRLTLKRLPPLVIKAGSPPRRPEAETEADPAEWQEVEAPPEDNPSPEAEPVMPVRTATALSERLKSMSEEGTPFLLLCDNGQENCEECAAHAGVC